VHQVGDQTRLYYDARSTNYQGQLYVYHFVYSKYLYPVLVGRDSVVGVATGHGLGRPGIKFRKVQDFPRPFRPALGHPPSHLFNGYRVIPEDKSAVVWR
jgi:hypothetical protein